MIQHIQYQYPILLYVYYDDYSIPEFAHYSLISVITEALSCSIGMLREVDLESRRKGAFRPRFQGAAASRTPIWSSSLCVLVFLSFPFNLKVS